MTAWQLTAGLQNLRAQVNAAFPARDHTSDGTIGDAAHQAEASSHNPDDTAGARPEWNGDPDSTPEVRAWDMDCDLQAAPATAQQLVDHLRALPGISSVLRYMIYSRRIYRASTGWKAEPYHGPSPHLEHIHFTGAFTQAADQNTSFDFRLEEIPVALTEADKAWFLSEIDAAAQRVVEGVARYPVNVHPAGPPSMQPWSRVDAYGSMERHLAIDGIAAVAKDVSLLKAQVDALGKSKA